MGPSIIPNTDTCNQNEEFLLANTLALKEFEHKCQCSWLKPQSASDIRREFWLIIRYQMPSAKTGWHMQCQAVTRLGDPQGKYWILPVHLYGPSSWCMTQGRCSLNVCFIWRLREHSGNVHTEFSSTHTGWAPTRSIWSSECRNE